MFYVDPCEDFEGCGIELLPNRKEDTFIWTIRWKHKITCASLIFLERIIAYLGYPWLFTICAVVEIS